MSTVITPPDKSNTPNAYLIFNATTIDIDMVMRWLRICDKEYTIYLYHDGMQDNKWASEVALECSHIIINRDNTEPVGLIPLYDVLGKITWVGKDQPYATAMEYFSKND